MPLHIACMYHLSHLHSKLFILAHEMVDREPENPISWYAVGVWYLGGQKWPQARQYFRSVGFFLDMMLQTKMPPPCAARHLSWIHALAQPGSPLDTRSLLKASMTTLLLRIQRARGCSQGMDCLLRQIR